MRHIFATLLTAILAAILTGCIEDGITTSPSDQPAFSTDTLKLGTVWTGSPTPTYRFTVYNRHDKILNLSRVAFRNDPDGHYRLNVDGTAGREITNVEIRPNDSVFVFVEATLPEAGRPSAIATLNHIDFTVNGITSSVAVTADACDIRRITALTITADTAFTADYPIQILDSVKIAKGATLTLEAGTRLLFHDKARMIVEGSLRALGTPDNRVDMTGDRTGNVVAAIPYDIMSAQWGGVTFAPASRGNELLYTTIRNSTDGVDADSLSQLTMRGAILRNAADYPLAARHAEVTAVGCEIAEGGNGVVALTGGSHRFDHCTIANHYLFSIFGGPALQLAHLKAAENDDDKAEAPYLRAAFTNTIIYGLGDDMGPADLEGTGATFTRCLFRSAGTDDDNFVRCLWDSDPLYMVDRMKYIFDYRLREGSPAIGAAEASEFAPVLSPDGTAVDDVIGAYGPAE